MITPIHLLLKHFLCVFLLAILMTPQHLFAQSGIYVGGHFRRERTHTVTDLKASGFTYVILFNINVEANGDLTTDGELMCTNGTYVFGSTSPYYASDVASLETGITSVNRVESCIGGWGNHSYANIKNLVNSQGTGTGSILYKNFKALKNAIPSMDAINNDDEETYDVNSATAFHVMLADIGFKTTLAPYMNKPYWQSLATNVNNQRGGAVDRIYLQLYEGGAGNNPCDWNINNIQLHTGDLNYEDATTMINKMTSAKNNCNSKGGFIWVYNDNNINLKELASRINNIFGVKAKNTKEVANFYNDCNYMGFANGLEVGDYNLSQLQSMGITNDVISSLTIAEGFEVTLFDGANFDGVSKTYRGKISCLVADGWNDKAASLKIRTTGVTNLSGTYFIQNRNSGLYMDVYGGTSSLGDGANIQQWNTEGTSNQQFQFTHLGNGTYKILAVHSSKSVDVSGINKDEGANVQQWTYYGTPNQQFVMVSTGDGYYKMIPKHSGKVVEVANASTAPEANVRQWGNNNQLCGQWKLIPVTGSNGNGDGLSADYYNGTSFQTLKVSRKDATVNFNWGSGSPDPNVNSDGFSVRWSGKIQPRYSGTYTFYVNSDNGRRLWINNQLIIDKWIDDWGEEYSGTISLTAGQKYDIKLEYFENYGGANCKLEWSSSSQTREVVPQSQLYSNPSTAFTQTVQAESYSSMSGVQTETTTDTGGGLNVGWIDTGDWMAYNSINVPTSGTYLVEYRVASPNSTSQLSLDLNAGSVQLGAVNIPNTGGWQNWTIVSHSVNINAGTYNFGIFAQTGGFNLNWWKISKSSSARLGEPEAIASWSYKEGLNIYPNPVDHHLFISSELNGAKIHIQSIDGIHHLKGIVSKDGIDVSQLNPGVYTIVIEHNGNKTIRKFIKN